MSIGSRRIRGTIQDGTVVVEESGYGVETAGPIATAATEWVEIRTMTGREAIAAQQAFGTVSATMKLRYRDDLDATMQFVTDQGETWVFKSPPMDPDGKRKELEVLVVKA